MRRTPFRTCVAAVALAAALAAPAFADGLSANLSLTSKYKYRGQDQSDTAKQVLPAVQGGCDYTLGGFYAGNWNSAIGFASGTEMDFYGGYKGDLGSGLGFDVGLLTYYYPGSGNSALNTTELYGALSYSFLSAKYSHTVSNKYFGLTEGQNTGYLDLSANYEVAKGVTLNGHVGFTRFTSDGKNQGAANYTDFKLGATYDFGGGITLAGAAIGANKKNVYGDLNKTRLVVTLTKTM